MTLRVGIDPGKSGAIALIDNDSLVELWDMPITGEGKGSTVSAALLGDILSEIIDISALAKETIPTAYLEAVAAMPGQGVSSMFSFGRAFGVVEGVLGAKNFPHILVRPAIWKRRARLLKKQKDLARAEAMRLFPEASQRLKRKKDVGRADAILIAFYGDNS